MMSIEEILSRLAAKGANSQELLLLAKTSENEPLWRQDPRLYRAFANKLIRQGHPARGYELAREGLAWPDFENDRELEFHAALALVRSGNLAQAEVRLAALMQAPELRDPDWNPRIKTDIFSLKGRLLKDRCIRTRDPQAKTALAAESAAAYERAARLPKADSFPWINWATMTLMADDPDQARRLADETQVMAQGELAQPGRGEDYWVLATLAESCFLLGDYQAAREWYSQALKQANALGDFAATASMRTNALLIREKIKGVDEFESMFERTGGTLAVFAGHMLDHPERTAKYGLPPRFPQDPELIAAVDREIRAFFGNRDVSDEPGHPTPKLGFCSASCGSDLLFAEHLLGGEGFRELHVILPFALADFYSTSVDFGSPNLQNWRERCDKVRTDPRAQVHEATKEPHLGDDVLFKFANEYMQGLSILRARQRGVTPRALVVIDPSNDKSPSARMRLGTRFFLKTWKKTGYPIERIRLDRLRDQYLKQDPSAPSPSLPAPAAGTTPALTLSPSSPTMKRTKREIKAMLFADLKNFSTLPEDYTPQFFARYPRFLAKTLKSLNSPPLVQNTWGDGLHLIFKKVAHCAEAALRLLEAAEKIDWTTLGFPDPSSPMRIGVHAGPVYKGKDPVIGKRNYFGSHVTRAARIEPVTTPGCAFASEQFAALLVIEADDDYVCEYLGIEKLAKEYDTVPLYRLTRRWL